jgi:hypothetical protein
MVAQVAAQDGEPVVEVRVPSVEPAQLGERPFELGALNLAGQGDSVAVVAAIADGGVRDGEFAELAQMECLLQGGERVRSAVALRPSYVQAQPSDLLVFMTQDVNNVRRDDNLKCCHGEPLLVVERVPGSRAVTLLSVRAQGVAHSRSAISGSWSHRSQWCGAFGAFFDADQHSSTARGWNYGRISLGLCMFSASRR